MKIKLTKMQGCGNDFVIVDYDEYKKIETERDYTLPLSRREREQFFTSETSVRNAGEGANITMSEFAKKVCDRNFGVGADGLIIPKTEGLHSNSDIGWYFYNSDGSVAEMCGNGMRCFAKYVYDKGLVGSKTFTVDTLAGIKKPEILDNGQVRVNMGNPILKDDEIPFKGERVITVLDKSFEITPVSMGNPHCVIFIDGDVREYAEKYGKYIEKHEYFPKKTNTEFVKVKSKDEIDLCVFERGCGITLACGTGSCASVVAGVLKNLTEQKVKVNLPGGSVFVEWQGSKADTKGDVYLTGPCEYSFWAEYSAV